MLDIRVQLGEVIRLTARDRFRPSDGPITLRVTGVRLVANRPDSNNWVWVEGTKPDSDTGPGEHAQVLVRASRLGPRRVRQ